MERDVMHYDVLIVGAGPAGLSAAIRLKQLAAEKQQELSVCLLEKGAEIGSHIFSGAVFDPRALNELIPDWRAQQAPLHTPVSHDEFLLLSKDQAWGLPEALLPPMMRNQGNYIISLGELCKWLGQQAEQLGVEIYPGFAAQEMLYDDQGHVAGILTGDMGLDKQGQPTGQYTPGIEIRAPYTLIAEGTRGSLTRQLEDKYQLRAQTAPAKYGLGFKEVWRIPKAQHQPGLVQHSMGWPLDAHTGGGAFIYHHGEDLVSVGFVVHLDYANPYLSPFEEFQRFKTHARIASLLQGGERLSYGARAISEGGIQSLPALVFPGGALLGCSAGMVNVPRIKGSHNAMKSGMLAAEAVFQAHSQQSPALLHQYQQQFKDSWVWQDLYAARNIKPYLARFGTWLGSALGGLEMWLGNAGVTVPWTLTHQKADHESLRPAHQCQPIAYPKPDGKLSFDRLASVSLSNIAHDENQPNHLKLSKPEVAVTINWNLYAAPEQRYCPAGVYEILTAESAPRLQINAQNCIHCKTCDIKDPTQNITWVPPEGGSGPNYVNQ